MPRVREIDAVTAPDDDLLALHEIEASCRADVSGAEPGRTASEAVAFYRHVPRGHPRRRWLADSDDGVAGAAALVVHAPTFVFCEVLVAPSQRRQGIGTELLGAVRAGARELGLDTLFAHHGTPAGAAFAARAGARDDQRDIRALLDLRSAELPSPVVPPGWRLQTWTRRAPDELVESFARARDAMNDAPAPAGVESHRETVEDVRSVEDAAAKRGREVRVTVAVDERGEIGAFTDLRVTPGAVHASTDDTGVAAWARGRGLAVAVKVESLRRLRADRPEVVHVTTMNAEPNARMREINRRIGFVPTVTLTTAVLRA